MNKQADLVRRIEEMAAAEGYTIAQLFGKKPRQSASESITPKYADPENPSLTWSGRGRRPRWVTEQLESGRSLDDLAL